MLLWNAGDSKAKWYLKPAENIQESKCVFWADSKQARAAETTDKWVAITRVLAAEPWTDGLHGWAPAGNLALADCGAWIGLWLWSLEKDQQNLHQRA